MFHAQRPIEAAAPLVSLPTFPNTDNSRKAALSLRHVGKSYAGIAMNGPGAKAEAQPHPAVSDLSLEVPAGLVFGIIGRSGAGKSTLLRMAALLERPDSGEVFHDGRAVHALGGEEQRKARRRVGVVFQNFNLFASRTAAGNVAFPMEAAGLARQEVRDRTRELLGLVGLPDKAARPVSRLSGGERQRVAIARALALEPDILFFDEATSALDPETTRSILDLVAELRERLGLTVVMVTHQMEVVRRACSLVAVLDGGRLAEVLPVGELFRSPSSPAARRLVAGEALDA
jgi:D-methionine transport system ATP-binding protein